jgi:uncharacterized protein (DUF1810 family)
MDDPYDLNRFVKAQVGAYEIALAELHAGRKRSHWMWFVFPQFAGLGASWTSQKYAIKSVDEAKAYLAHPTLGPRLVECCEALLGIQGRTAYEIMGQPDDLKLRSCATLFAQVAPPGGVFAQVLAKYCDGKPDKATLKLMHPGGGSETLA